MSRFKTPELINTGIKHDAATVASGVALATPAQTMPWTLISPGTGGNIQSIGLPPGDADSMWVGSDNAGMMHGKQTAFWWAFEGAQKGIDSQDIGDIASVTLPSGTLSYAVAGWGIGPSGEKERRGLYVRADASKEWTPVPMSLYRHIWSSNGPPKTKDWPPPGTEEEEEYNAGSALFYGPSLVRVHLLPGNDGRHLVVLGGNNEARQFFESNIRVTKQAEEQSYKIGTKEVTPRGGPPTFYVCVARWKDGALELGDWIGATFLDEYVLWETAAGPPERDKGPRRVYYDRLTGVGGMWLDPEVQQTLEGAQLRVYFTVRMMERPNTDPSLVEPEHFRVGVLRILLPAAGAMNFEIPSKDHPTRPLQLKSIHIFDKTTGLGQVAGTRPSSKLRLLVTTPLAPPAQCIRWLEESATEAGEFGPPVIDDISALLMKYYGPAGTDPAAPSYGGLTVGTFFFAASTHTGWVYVGAAVTSVTVIGPGLWRWSPDDGLWSRVTFLMGDAPGPALYRQLVLSHPLVGVDTLQVAIGVVVETPFECTPSDRRGLAATVSYLVDGVGQPNLLTPWLDPFLDGELIQGVQWTVGEVPPKGYSGRVTLQVQLSCFAARGAAAVSVMCRPKPKSGCPATPPARWSDVLSGWKVGGGGLSWTAGPSSTTKRLLLTVTAGKAVEAEPNMHRQDTWRGRHVDQEDYFD